MKFLSEKRALDKLRLLISNFKSEISDRFEHRAKSCLTCDVKGSCCLDAHFVNVHISRLEAVAINQVLDKLPAKRRDAAKARIAAAIDRYNLSMDGDTYSQTYACPLFEKGIGCLVHSEAKPAPCIAHACYANEADVPPGELLAEQELLIDDLNEKTYGRPHLGLPIPLALMEKPLVSLPRDKRENESR